MQATPFNFEPVYIASTAGNLLNGTVTSMAGPVGITLGQPVIYIKHIQVTNVTGTAATFTLYKGLTGGSSASTVFGFGASETVPGNATVDVYFAGQGARFDVADFLSGVASAASTLVINMEGDVTFKSA